MHKVHPHAFGKVIEVVDTFDNCEIIKSVGQADLGAI
ncbi:protein of unknown function [Petrocella atlantisensis]|uniref:Uncharacterized protein n=1 Tax=Petrocella atlantisensis TaxID=2173034 RepID=A0A3P7RU98_9FIRM|nr:protein of unknown function [Petrocella atlantisensis]